MPKTGNNTGNSIRAFVGLPMAISREALDAMASGAFSFWYDDPPPKPVMTVIGGVAVVPVVGTLVKEDDKWSQSSFASVRAMVSTALANRSIRALCLQVNSPGGTVDGALEAHDFLKSAAKQKPLYAYIDGSMRSAAYWIGSAAKAIAAPATASVGSVGVLTLHVDVSKADERYGEKYTYLTAGRFKAAGNSHEPLGDDAREDIQVRLDGIYGLFLDSVSKNRRLSVESAETWADGKIFLAQQAVDAGLIDCVVSDMSEFIASIQKKEGINMNLAEFQASHPELYTEVVGIGRAEAENTFEARVAATQAAERAGILALVGVAVGEEAKTGVEKLLAAGVNAEQAIAVKSILAPIVATPSGVDSPKADQRSAMLAAMEAAGPKPVEGEAGKSVSKDFLSLVEAYQAQRKCGKSEAMKAVIAAHPEAHKAYLAAANPGKVAA